MDRDDKAVEDCLNRGQESGERVDHCQERLAWVD
jgi:hypothetical protein